MRCVRCAVVALVLAGLGGCVHREIEIMTRPPGAQVEFDGRVLEEKTPVRFPFVWYGTHEIILTKPGYFRNRLFVHIGPPWYEQFPLDFFTENLWPGWLYDLRSYPVALEKWMPMVDIPDDEKAAMREGLLERASQFRVMAREVLGLPPVEEPLAPEKPAPAEAKEPPEKTQPAPEPEKK